jgi:hypothetical protein
MRLLLQQQQQQSGRRCAPPSSRGAPSCVAGAHRLPLHTRAASAPLRLRCGPCLGRAAGRPPSSSSRLPSLLRPRRVLALKMLCDLRAERDDVREALESALGPRLSRDSSAPPEGGEKRSRRSQPVSKHAGRTQAQAGRARAPRRCCCCGACFASEAPEGAGERSRQPAAACMYSGGPAGDAPGPPTRSGPGLTGAGSGAVHHCAL